MLSLLWKDIDLKGGAKLPSGLRMRRTGENRHIPISARLRAVLEMATHDPAGERFGPERHAFGDQVGRRLTNPAKAWQATVLKANGHTPKLDYCSKKLKPESQDIYRRVDLKFDDLRHEGGSRWLEAGMSIHHVKVLLWHASLATTDTYLNATKVGLCDAMRRVDAKRKAELEQAGHPQSASLIERSTSTLVN